jgi:hypothetical protein
MSGGELEYTYLRIDNVVKLIKEQTTNPLYTDFANHLELVRDALHDLEWELSGDFGEKDAEPAIKKVLKNKKK